MAMRGSLGSQPSTGVWQTISYGRSQHAVVARAGHSIEEDAGKRQVRIECFKTMHHCSYTTGGFSAVHDQQDGELEKFGDLGTTANVIETVLAIKQPHHAFDDNRICSHRGLLQHRAVGLLTQQPGIEIACFPAGNAWCGAWYRDSLDLP